MTNTKHKEKAREIVQLSKVRHAKHLENKLPHGEYSWSYDEILENEFAQALAEAEQDLRQVLDEVVEAYQWLIESPDWACECGYYDSDELQMCGMCAMSQALEKLRSITNHDI
jgi:hypothetical protein